jgi:hypothetical protein
MAPSRLESGGLGLSGGTIAARSPSLRSIGPEHRRGQIRVNAASPAKKLYLQAAKFDANQLQ